MKPILFNTEMVKAVLEGRKTVTRRVIKPQPEFVQSYSYKGKLLYESEERTWCYKNIVFQNWCEVNCIVPFAPYQIGNILYVRETFRVVGFTDGKDDYDYKADGCDPLVDKGILRWHPSLHMPREAARIFLKVTDVRVERLQEITHEQAIKEGLKECGGYEVDKCDCILAEYLGLWNSTIKKQDLEKYGWNSNSFVWVYEFERCMKPIEANTYETITPKNKRPCEICKYLSKDEFDEPCVICHELISGGYSEFERCKP
jgi:hypothetical protein